MADDDGPIPSRRTLPSVTGMLGVCINKRRIVVGKHKAQVKHYDYDAKEYVVDAEVSIHSLARSLDGEQFAQLLDDYVNDFSKGDYRHGLKLGHELRNTHRTLQRSAIVMLVGIIAGLSEQEYTDARNEYAVHLAKQIKGVYEEIGAGRMI